MAADGEAIRVVLDPRAADGLDDALTAIEGVQVTAPPDRQGVVAALRAGAEVLVSWDWWPEYLQPGLRWVQGRGIGFDRFPWQRLEAAGVILTTSAGIHHTVVAEHAFALLLALYRGLPQSVRHASERRWVPRVGRELAGSAIGIVGLGSVGTAFARRCAGWDVRLIGVSRSGKRHPLVERVRPVTELRSVCEEVDVLVVCLPQPADRRPVLREEHLRALGGRWLINVGRGGVVDERALVELLASGHLAGAGLDVFEVEPLPEESRLWQLPNVIITPHIAGSTNHYAERFLKLFVSNIAAYRGSGKWVNRVVHGRVTHRWHRDSTSAAPDNG